MTITRWAPVTEVPFNPVPDTRNGIDFILTNAERSKCAVYSMQAMAARRRANELDAAQRRAADARAAQRALDGFDGVAV